MASFVPEDLLSLTGSVIENLCIETCPPDPLNGVSSFSWIVDRTAAAKAIMRIHLFCPPFIAHLFAEVQNLYRTTKLVCNRQILFFPAARHLMHP